MDNKQYNALFSFIWNIANDVLVHAFEKGDYKKTLKSEIDPQRLKMNIIEYFNGFSQDVQDIIGYELSFTKYFYKPVQLRTLNASWKTFVASSAIPMDCWTR